MDWVKTKNILIIGLLITNLILAYQIYRSDSLFNQNSVEEDDSVKEIVGILEKKNIRINLDKVNYYTKLMDIEVAYERNKPDEVASKLLNRYNVNANGAFENANYTLAFPHKAMEIDMKYKNVPKTLSTIPMEEAKLVSDNFLRSLGFYSTDVLIANTQESKSNGSYEFQYKQRYKDLFLEDSSMTVTIHDGKVIAFTRKWLEVTRTSDMERIIIPPSKALLNFSAGFENPLKTTMIITSIELGYRLSGVQFKGDISSGDALPYWRISTSSGQTYFIEAIE